MVAAATNSNANSSATINNLMATVNAKTSTSSTSTIDDAESRFLKLLTTQLQNQDPLNPADNAQITSQLAQISTVQGISKLNTTLQTLVDNNNASQAIQAASLVGKGALVPGSGLILAGGKAAGGYELADAADKVNLNIKDSSGKVIRTIDLGAQKAGLQTFAWDGKDDAGVAAVDGTYSISISATQGASKVDVTNLQVGAVNSVAGKGSNVTLNVSGVGAVGIADVREII